MFKEPDMTDPSFIYADMHDRKLPLTVSISIFIKEWAVRCFLPIQGENVKL